jgi:pimeloyl-ACP methyl ester carboxylesterase
MNFEDALSWISNHESALSGIAAAIVIASVVLAVLRYVSRSVRKIRGGQVSAGNADAAPAVPLHQDIRFCRTADDVRLAYARVGEGVPIVRALGWFTHLEFEWENASSRFFWEELAQDHEVIRYDGRGMGLSEREVDHISLETRLADLEAVVDAAGLERFALMGFSEGGTTAIAYAAKHPERVSHLVLWGTFLSASDRTDMDQWTALVSLIPENWGKDAPAFHQLFVSMFLPDAAREHNELFIELQRCSTSGPMAVRVLASIADVDVAEEASRVQAPTLVMHRKGDLVCPAAGARAVAAQIPGARLELLEGSNHWMWMREDSTSMIISRINAFIDSV